MSDIFLVKNNGNFIILKTDIWKAARPETVLRWHKKLVAKKYDSSKVKCKPGHPKVDVEIEQLVLKFVKENRSWGYGRITGTIRNLGYKISASTVANIIHRNGFNPSGDRTKGGMTWSEFIKIHKDVIWAADFFTAEVWTPFGLATYYVLFFIQIKTKKVVISCITAHPNDDWMAQVARNLTAWDYNLENAKYLIHDRDTKYSAKFDAIIRSGGIKPIKLPPRFSNLNAFSKKH